ncbi:hypothetical protein CDAR_51401 [Caerostris darwini]|uniref:Secreted protein n=1 Tax=Caerostris darwini TaxID=1538125 RepID=A0AAV4U642_9ARAC|nr:hypothetical protein CDAR_51401 [Caerostris darwini]
MLSSVWVSLLTKGLCHTGWPATKSLYRYRADIRPLLSDSCLETSCPYPTGCQSGKGQVGIPPLFLFLSDYGGWTHMTHLLPPD